MQRPRHEGQKRMWRPRCGDMRECAGYDKEAGKGTEAKTWRQESRQKPRFWRQERKQRPRRGGRKGYRNHDMEAEKNCRPNK